MNWVVANSALTITLIGGCCAVIGYFYRARTERLRNYRLALFILLRIWHRFGLLSRVDFNPEIDSIFSGILHRFPDAVNSDVEMRAVKAYFTPYLRQVLINRAFEGFESIEDAYGKAVHLVSLHDPVYGYELDSIKSIRSRLGAIDQYFSAAFGQSGLEDNPNSQLSMAIHSKVKSFAQNDAIMDIESAINRLSLKVSIFTRLRVRKIFQSRKALLAQIPEDTIQKIVDEVLVPAIESLQHLEGDPFSATPLASAKRAVDGGSLVGRNNEGCKPTENP